MNNDKQRLSLTWPSAKRVVLVLGLTTSLLGVGLWVYRSIVAIVAEDSYSCGPHLATYSVRSLEGTSGQGVRCVGFIPATPSSIEPSAPIGFFWYGEGIWINTRYRHIGEFIYGEDGRAGDLFDENQDFTPKVRLSVTPDGKGLPNTIRVTDTWNEEWTLETDGKVSKYVSVFGPVRKCGGNFKSFDGISITDGRRIGIRCQLRDARVWYGEGALEGGKYTHIGFILDDTGAVGANEICDPSRSDFCNHFNFGSSVLKEIPGKGFRLEPNSNKEAENPLEEEWIYSQPQN